MKASLNPGRGALVVGATVVCAETGEPFTIVSDGCSFNYATTSDGAILSDKGVDIREKRGLLDHSKPFVCYLSTDGKRVTGWKGNTLGCVASESTARNPFGGHLTYIRAIDVHGHAWHGRGAGRGMCLKLKACK